MAARFGHVLYWAASLIAALMIGTAAFAVIANGVAINDAGILATVFYAVIIWLIGLACRYVLAGPKSK